MKKLIMETPHIDYKISELSFDIEYFGDVRGFTERKTKQLNEYVEIKERLKTAEYIESKILSWYQQTRDEKFAEFFDIVNTRKNSNP